MREDLLDDRRILDAGDPAFASPCELRSPNDYNIEILADFFNRSVEEFAVVCPRPGPIHPLGMKNGARNVKKQLEDMRDNVSQAVLSKQSESTCIGIRRNVLPETQSGPEDREYLQNSFTKDGGVAAEYDMRHIVAAKELLRFRRHVAHGEYGCVLVTEPFYTLSKGESTIVVHLKPLLPSAEQ